MGQMPRLASDFVPMAGYTLPHDFVAPNGFVLPPGLTMPAGATVPFADPVVMPNQSTTPGVVEVNLDARLALVNINGAVANLMTYNGHYPAPTIKVRRGDILKVHFTNSLPDTGLNLLGHQRGTTNLHTHGFHVSPSGNSDNPMLQVKSGASFDYVYDLSRHPAGNLNYYHPHSHGASAEQLWGGLAGAIEVADDDNALAGFETHTLVLKDISLSGSAAAPHSGLTDYMLGKEGNIVMVNGQVNPTLAMQPGQVQRWRILNASNARFYKLSLANHTLQIIGTDGGLLDKPYPVSTILVSPGERLDVLIKASSTAGSYKLVALPYYRGGMMMGSTQVVLMTTAVSGEALSQDIPQTIDPTAVRLVAPADVTNRRLVLGMGMMGGMMGGGMSSFGMMGGTLSNSMSSTFATINGVPFTETTAYTVNSRLNTHEIWEIINQSFMDHPFHLHVNSAQVMSVTGGDRSYAALYTTAPARKDTVIVPSGGSVRLLVPIADFVGDTVFHCHILEHEDLGMMGVWSIK